MKHQLGMAVLTGVSALAVAWTANAQTAASDIALEEVVVTGSRVIANGNESPTPVTVVTLEALQASRPTTVFEGLQEMPVFSAGNGGAVGGRTGQGGNNNSIASLNLRGLGSVRGLMLFNGHRVPPQNLNGQVDLNQIPQMVLQRVDVQTGGSSAVYGSDAITGVVNFLVDRKFNGLKVQGQYGFDDRGDSHSNELGVAFGSDLFSSRGHVIGSVQSHYDSGLYRTDRSWVATPQGGSWSLQGNGSAATPYFITQNALDPRITTGGVIVCPAGSAAGQSGTPNPAGCPTRPLVGQNFSSNGVLSPFVNGSTAGVTGANQIGGGGGNANQKVTLKVPVKFLQFYGRFDFDLTDNLHFFVESYYTKENQFSTLANARSSSSASSSLANGLIMSVDNAFLPAAYRQALVNGGQTTFNVGKVWDTDFYNGATFDYDNRNVYVNTGLEGSFGDSYKWEISGTKAKANQANVAHNTWDTGKLFAALDSVLVNGQPTCWVSTQPQYASRYPGCVPLNIFGPTATTDPMWQYLLKPTKYEGITETTDVEGYISGAPFSTWAGEVNLALSAEWRKLEYEFISEGEPANVDPVDCTGLLSPRPANCVPQSATNAGTSIFPNGTAGLRPVSQTVKEAALEAEVPLLADKRFAQRVALNGAYRRAEYSATGTPAREIPVATTEFSADTWKVGLNWQFNDAVTVRATRSRDFRAPNMSELYLPGRVQGFSVIDRLIKATPTSPSGVTVNGQQQVGGNPELLPEVGYTTTVGIVLQPSPDFSLAIDAFDISITDAITGIDGSTATVQDACYDSGGSSPYCEFQRRPGGFSRTPANEVPANAALYWYTQSFLNLAETRTSGVDVEANWKFELAKLPINLRLLTTYQPHIWLIQDLVPTDDAGGVSSPRLRALVSARIGLTDNLSLNWTTRWRSELNNVSPRVIVNGAPAAVAPGSGEVSAVAFSNLTLNYRVPQITSGALDVYLNVLNVFDKAPPAYVPLASGSPFSGGAGTGGVGFYPADDGIGRYINVGFRYRM